MALAKSEPSVEAGQSSREGYLVFFLVHIPLTEEIRLLSVFRFT